MSERAPREGAIRELLVVAPIALVALAAAFPGYLLGESLFTRDTSIYFWPTKHFLGQSLAGGDLPMWIPGASSGQPFLANPKNSLLYPPQLLYAFLPARLVFHLLPFVHLWILFSGAYLWLRQVLGGSRLASTTGGLALVLSGFVLSSAEFHAHLLALAWLPWIVWLAARVQRRPTARRVAVLALPTALLLLAGAPYVAVVTAGLSVVQWASLRPRTLRGAAALALAGTLGAGLAAPQILPALVHLSGTQRAVDASAQGDLALEPAQLLQLAAPRVFGRADRIDGWARYAMEHSPLYVSIHWGAAVLLLAVAVIACGRRRWLVLALAASGLTLACLGHALGLVDLPLLRLIRHPAKYALLLALAAPVAVADALDSLGRPRVRGALAVAATAGFLIAIAAIAGSGLWVDTVARYAEQAPRGNAGAAAALVRADLLRLAAVGALLTLGVALAPRRVAAARWALAAVVVLELAVLAPSINPTFPLSSIDSPGPLLDALPHEGRLWRDPAAARSRIAHADDSIYWEPARNVRTGAWLSGLPGGARYALDPDYDRFYIGSSRALWGSSTNPGERRRLLRMLGVTHVLAESVPFDDAEVVVEDGISGVQLYALEGAVAIVRRVGRVRPAASESARIAAALAPGFDPTREAVIQGAAPAAGTAAGSVEVVSETADRLAVRVQSEEAGWLVWTTTAADGWRAYVDGRRQPILRADVEAMAVGIPGGSHEVDFRYRPPGLVSGLAIAALSLLALVAGTSLAPASGHYVNPDVLGGQAAGRLRSLPK